MANAAWLALTVMAHNLGRSVGQLAGPELNTATAATLRRKVFTMPGRLVHSGRRQHLRLPENWPWQDAITTALERITAIPMRCSYELVIEGQSYRRQQRPRPADTGVSVVDHRRS